MGIKFCDKCGGILMIEGKKAICHICGSVDNSKNILSSSEKIQEKEFRGKGVASSKNIFADYTNECKNCGHNKAEIIDCGIFYSDEDNLIFLKCGKCGFSERIGRKTS